MYMKLNENNEVVLGEGFEGALEIHFPDQGVYGVALLDKERQMVASSSIQCNHYSDGGSEQENEFMPHFDFSNFYIEKNESKSLVEKSIVSMVKLD